MRTGAKGGPTADISTSSKRQAVKMANISRGLYRNRQALGSDVEDLNTTCAVTPRTMDEESFHPVPKPRQGILVTKEFTTESVQSN